MISFGKTVFKKIQHRLFDKSLASYRRYQRKKEHRLLFAFAGLHGFWPGMGRGLYRTEPVFRETVLRCSRSIKHDFDVIEYFEEQNQFTPTADSSVLIVQVIVHLALAELWRSKGVEPDAILGCSLGVLTSCGISEALTFEDVLRVAYYYARCPVAGTSSAKLISLGISPDALSEIDEQCPVDLHMVVDFGPSQIIVACEIEDLHAACSFFDQSALTYNVFPGEHLTHTPSLAAALRAGLPSLTNMASASSKYPLYSSLGGARYPKAVSFDATFWYWQATKPCLFIAPVRQALEEGCDTIVIIGTDMVRQSLYETAQHVQKDVQVFPSISAGEPEEITFARTLARLSEFGLVHSRSTQSDESKPQAIGVSPKSLNLCGSDVSQDPYSYYESLRGLGPVHFLEQHGYWIVLDYDDVASALKQSEIFSSAARKELDPVLIGKDAPDHTVIRQALLPHFSMRGLSDIGAYIEQCAQDLLKPAISRNEFDIVKEFAMPLADLVMGHVLGLTVEEVNSLQRSIDSNRYQPSYFSSLERFFSDYAKTRDGKSEDHFLQRLVHAAGTKELGEAEIVSLLKLLWIGGTTTTSALISTSVQIFLYHHAVAYEIQNDSDLVPQFVEEALRFDPPEQMVARVTLHEAQVAGCSIPLNAQVRLCLGAANRDSKHYTNPDLFILSRNPKDHLAFGAGAHYCLGAVLGRLEAQIALKTLLQMCPRIRASQPAQSSSYMQSDQFRLLEKLLVRAR